MKLTHRDKLVLHMALMEYLERRIGDPSQPDGQIADSVLNYVNWRYGNHGLGFRSTKYSAVQANCIRAKALLRAFADEPDEPEQPT